MATIDDVQWLMENSTETNYLFNSDSALRDKSIHPHANHYTVNFDSPFWNVIGFDVVDATIPRTQYLVDAICNGLAVNIGTGPHILSIPVGDHTNTSLISALNNLLSSRNIEVGATTSPPELRNMISFTSPIAFSFDMSKSSARNQLGFSERAAGNSSEGTKFLCVDPISGPDIYTSIPTNPHDVLAFAGAPNIQTPILFSDNTSARYLAQKFSPSQSGVLKQISVACYIMGQPDDMLLDWYIASNDPLTGCPGSIIATGQPISVVDFTASNPYVQGSGPSIVNIADGVNMIAGENYWLVFHCETSLPDTAVGIYEGIPNGGSYGAVKWSSDGAVWQADALNSVDITAVHLVVTVTVSQSTQTILAPGILNLVGDPYCVLRIPEIETHVFRDRAYEKYTFGMAQFKLAVVGYASSRFDYASVPYRRFHPIGKLQSMTLMFCRPNSTDLYDFKEVDHNLVIVIRYLIPKMKSSFKNNILNPEYDPDPMDRYNRLQDTESEEEEELSDEEEEDIENANPSAIHNVGGWTSNQVEY
jgi:hypothetical protein